MDSSNKNKNSNRGPYTYYEEVEMDKNFELTQNISYDTVKNILMIIIILFQLCFDLQFIYIF